MVNALPPYSKCYFRTYFVNLESSVGGHVQEEDGCSLFVKQNSWKENTLDSVLRCLNKHSGLSMFAFNFATFKGRYHFYVSE